MPAVAPLIKNPEGGLQSRPLHSLGKAIVEGF